MYKDGVFPKYSSILNSVMYEEILLPLSIPFPHAIRENFVRRALLSERSNVFPYIVELETEMCTFSQYSDTS